MRDLFFLETCLYIFSRLMGLKKKGVRNGEVEKKYDAYKILADARSDKAK